MTEEDEEAIWLFVVVACLFGTILVAPGLVFWLGEHLS